jgi:hypothetical protein
MMLGLLRFGGHRMLKLLTIVVAGILTVITLRRLLQEMRAKEVGVRVSNPDLPRPAKRLRQDADTGVYYPES